MRRRHRELADALKIGVGVAERDAERLRHDAERLVVDAKAESSAFWVALARWRDAEALVGHFGTATPALREITASAANWLWSYAPLDDATKRQRAAFDVASLLQIGSEEANVAVLGARRWGKHEIADTLGIPLALRDELALSTVGATDLDPVGLSQLLKERKRSKRRAAAEARRREAGAASMAERRAWRAELRSMAAAAGVSEATMRRRWAQGAEGCEREKKRDRYKEDNGYEFLQTQSQPSFGLFDADAGRFLARAVAERHCNIERACKSLSQELSRFREAAPPAAALARLAGSVVPPSMIAGLIRPRLPMFLPFSQRSYWLRAERKPDTQPTKRR